MTGRLTRVVGHLDPSWTKDLKSAQVSARRPVHVHLHITNESGRGTNGPSARDFQVLEGALQGYDIKFTHGFSVPEDANYQILVSGMPKEDMLTASPKLEIVCVPWAGIVPKMKALMQKHPNIATHSIHHNSAPTAEMAVSLILAAAKRIVPCDQQFRNNDWRARYDPAMSPTFLGNKTALVLGFGRIGRLTANILMAMGMKILATDAYDIPGLDPRISLHKPDAMHDLLPQAHVVIVCLPDTPKTREIIGRRELSLLPKNAVLVNVGRAHVCNQKELYECLKDGTLGAAGLDVWWHYPSARKGEAARRNTAPGEYPFGELPNVVMSPHRAGVAKEIDQFRMEHLAEVFKAYADNKTVPGRLNLKLGF